MYWATGHAIHSNVKPKPIEKPKKHTSMYEDDNIPGRLINGFPRPTPKAKLSKNDILHDVMAELFAKYPSSAFKWNWRKLRYECEIDGVKGYATLYEYRKSRRIRFHTYGVT